MFDSRETIEGARDSKSIEANHTAAWRLATCLHSSLSSSSFYTGFYLITVTSLSLLNSDIKFSIERISISLLLHCQHLKFSYLFRRLCICRTDRWCWYSPVSPSSQGWQRLSFLHKQELFRQAELDLAGSSSDTSGCLKCNVFLPHAAELLSPGSKLSPWEAAINCCSLCFYSPTMPWLLTHTGCFSSSYVLSSAR